MKKSARPSLGTSASEDRSTILVRTDALFVSIEVDEALAIGRDSKSSGQAKPRQNQQSTDGGRDREAPEQPEHRDR